MQQGITPDELFIRIIRSLYRLEDLFVEKYYTHERHAIQIIIVHTRMLHNHCKMMSSARDYLISRIKTLTLRERKHNFEISVLRNTSSEEETRELVDYR